MWVRVKNKLTKSKPNFTWEKTIVALKIKLNLNRVAQSRIVSVNFNVNNILPTFMI